MTDYFTDFDFDAFMAIFVGVFLIVIIVLFLVGLLIGSLFLKFGINKVGGKDTKYGTVFLTYLLMVLVSAVPCAGIFLAWWVISTRHGTSYGKAILAWLIAGLLMIVVNIVIFIAAYFLGFIPPELLEMFVFF